MTLVLLLAFTRSICALTPGDLSRVTFDQHPGHQISRDLVFRDENDRPFRLGNQFGKQPTILVLGYYRCPMLCMLINDGLIRALQELPLSIGPDFQVVTVSIDPTEKAAAAAAKKSEYLRQYGRPGAADGWHFLVGDEPSVAKLADEAGFRYAYDPQIRQYAHPSGIIVLTPEGKISRYLFGAKFDAKELSDALIAAKKGKSSSIISQVFLLCYHYNPITGKFGGLILSILRIGSVGFLAAIALWIFSLTRRPAREPVKSG
jgi:protein SCO1/2